LHIHNGHPLKREIFTHSIAYSTSIKDLKLSFDWQAGPKWALETILTHNTFIRKLELHISDFDNDLCLLDYFRQNKWIKELRLDVNFTD